MTTSTYKAGRSQGQSAPFMQARYYSPGVGRFLSEDPYGGAPQDPLSLHRYLYCANGPVSRTDPSGETILVGALVGIAAAAITAIPIVRSRCFDEALCQLEPIHWGIHLVWLVPGALFLGVCLALTVGAGSPDVARCFKIFHQIDTACFVGSEGTLITAAASSYLACLLGGGTPCVDERERKERSRPHGGGAGW